MTKKAKAESLFIRADKADDAGDFRSAFRLMLAAAKLGDVGAQVNVGNYYDAGKGVRRNLSAALYWYKRAYRRGCSSAASNIGVLWRNERNLPRALEWFERAARLGDDEANLEIGKHYLLNERNPQRAIAYFQRVRRSDWVSEAGTEEAAALLRRTRKLLHSVRAR
jgi:TPR repeat protein